MSWCHFKTLFNATLVVLLVALGVTTRMYGIRDQPVTRDESFSWRMIQYSMDEQIRRTALDVHPPLYYLLLTIWSQVFGASISALRGMSVLLTVAVIPVTVACVRMSLSNTRLHSMTGPLLAGTLVAVHIAQVEAGRNARMYGLGVFLTVATATLLTLACNSKHSRSVWWLFYTLCAAAFVHTHNYALFTVFAQLIYSVCFSRRLANISKTLGRAHLLFSGSAFCGVFICFLPWLWVLLEQVRMVQAGYWIDALRLASFPQKALAWTIGVDMLSAEEAWFGIFCIGALVTNAIISGAAGSVLFWGLHAVMPWICGLAVSWHSGTPIVHDRYLVFAHVGMIGVLSVCVSAIPAKMGRVLVAVITAGPVGFWCINSVMDLSASASPLDTAMEFVAQHHRAGDRILASSCGELNRLLYYATESGIARADVRCRSDGWNASAHQTHVASLNRTEAISLATLNQKTGTRWWIVDRYSMYRPTRANRELLRKIVRTKGEPYIVALCVTR